MYKRTVVFVLATTLAGVLAAPATYQQQSHQQNKFNQRGYLQVAKLHPTTPSPLSLHQVSFHPSSTISQAFVTSTPAPIPLQVYTTAAPEISSTYRPKQNVVINPSPAVTITPLSVQPLQTIQPVTITHHVLESELKPYARITSQDSDIHPDGSFTNQWSSENGIQVREQATLKNVGDKVIPVVQGEIAYVDEQGIQYHLRYIADENGYQPIGDHLPTPPPVPESVHRALEYIRSHPYVEPQQQYQGRDFIAGVGPTRTIVV